MRNQDTRFQRSHFRHWLLLLAFVGFSVLDTKGQQIQEVTEFEKAIGIQYSDSFRDLRFGGSGTIEVTDGNVVLPKNGKAKNVIVKSSDLSSLPREPGRFGSVQWMQINFLENSTMALHYNQLASFPGLNYILIVSKRALSKAQISNMLTGFENSGIVILYQISHPG